MSESPDIRSIAVVVIGRNEGERLRRCLESVRECVGTVVYVDSGSTDGSIAMAQEMGVSVVELDQSTPFTAARARNAGVKRLDETNDPATWIQFIDGDCEIVDGYLDAAVGELEQRTDAAAVAGRLRERFPEASVYNRLCDIEWDTPPGEVPGIGGISMFRRSALREVNGFNPTLIAGEEPELCVRLRLRDWKIYRVDVEMALHDAAMTRFGQWWKRMVRGGYAAMEGAVMHGRGPFRHKVSNVRSTLLWALAMPLVMIGSIVGMAMGSMPWGLLAIAVVGFYGLWFIRMFRRFVRSGIEPRFAVVSTGYAMLSKFAYLQGFSRYWRNRCLGRVPTLIEYKGVSEAG